ncbi:MAG: hypothetical protein AAGJ40_20275 [Planctomycetota bacterium]
MIDGKITAEQEARLIACLDMCTSCQQTLLQLESEQIRTDLQRSSHDAQRMKNREVERRLTQLRSERSVHRMATSEHAYTDVMP